MDSDEVNQSHEHMVDDWLHQLGKYNTWGIEKLASKYRNGDKCTCVKMNNGSFNWCFKVEFDDGTKWAVRFPVAGNVMFPEEKVQREVAVMKFLKQNTFVPVPGVIAYGMAADNHDPGMGLFIIEEWIDGVPLSTLMEEHPRPSWGPILHLCFVIGDKFFLEILPKKPTDSYSLEILAPAARFTILSSSEEKHDKSRVQRVLKNTLNFHPHRSGPSKECISFRRDLASDTPDLIVGIGSGTPFDIWIWSEDVLTYLGASSSTRSIQQLKVIDIRRTDDSMDGNR
ncbi:putative Altered inheritance of mitochondria protein 9, mitochondrial [Glarea lozoyensis 74030]|uniref:Putative Altered inheritance of mitochondria protein 9, mitochondrial n=1 Tax=Glarea lozoyensis (strain ATCC 74030 / MF5533) TaxID=1104152 RepID=H0EPD6_GLAL7|nr:putative Altered inheritance of mitochondria protein 9, mitochondrial [Glarea lozoyensis 74030]